MIASENLNQKELAKRCNLSVNTINNMLNMKKSPNFQTVTKLAQGLKCTVSELLEV
jgi:transcriptional regulator with XRE-family HTH domain